MRNGPGHTRLVDLRCYERIMSRLRCGVRLNCTANYGDDPLVLAVWRWEMIAQKAGRGCPDDRVARAKDLPSLLLNLWVGEELIQPVEAIPHIKEQELTCAS